MPLFGRWGSIGSAHEVMDLWEESLGLVDEEARRAGVKATRERLKDARVRWLEDNRAQRSFPCGAVPDPEPSPGEHRLPEPRLNVPRNRGMWMQVFAAVLPSDLAFIRGQDPGAIVEVGRLPRKAIRDVDVVDQAGAHIPAPASETFEPPKLALAVLRWTNEGFPDEDRFVFRSTWMAWLAARQLLAAKQ